MRISDWSSDVCSSDLFGLALGSYAHFTSPIRRYADLIVHRALVDSYRLEVPGKAKNLPERTGLGEADRKGLSRIGEAISALERRAMEAERATVARYVAAWLATKVGAHVPGRAKIGGGSGRDRV